MPKHTSSTMPLRDWFAGMAVNALIPSYGTTAWGVLENGELATEAYAIADAMIHQRIATATAEETDDGEG